MSADGLKVKHAMQFLREAQVHLARCGDSEARLASMSVGFAITRFEELFRIDMSEPATIESVVSAAREVA